jgi:hypothetical protein
VLGERRAREAADRVAEVEGLKDIRDLTPHLIPS